VSAISNYCHTQQAVSFEKSRRAMNITRSTILGKLIAFSGVCGGDRERSLALNDTACTALYKYAIKNNKKSMYINNLLTQILILISSVLMCSRKSKEIIFQCNFELQCVPWFVSQKSSLINEIE